MIVQDDHVQILNKAGLTVTQARVYLTLAQIGKATVKTIAKTAKIDRSNVYRIISDLQKQGLVKRLLATPSVYETTPLKDGISLLMQHKTEEYNEIKQKAEELPQQFAHNKEPYYGEDSFVLIPEKGAFLKIAENALNNTKLSMDIVSNLKGSLHGFSYLYEQNMKAALKRGVEIRIIFEASENEETPEILQSIKVPNLKLRYVRHPIKAAIGIRDDEEMIAFIDPEKDATRTPVLWTNNTSFIAIFREYFEKMWKNSTGIQTKNTNRSLRLTARALKKGVS